MGDASWLLWGDATRMDDVRVIARRARRRLTADIVSVKPVVGGWGG
jgi:beta-lactamase superfamily II metal-dependent hydrolase